jgi:glutaredoxin
LLIVGLVLARPLVHPPETPAPLPAVAEEPRTAEAMAELEPSLAPTPLAEAQAEPQPDAARGLDSAQPPSDSAASPEPSLPAASAALAPSAAPSASQARPTQAALASAVRSTPIVMFSTSWCPVCQTARAFLGANGLSYSERDIDRDANAREELKRRSGSASIPTLEVDGELLTPGFSSPAIMSAVAKSAQRRLGAKVEVHPRDLD